MREMQPPSGPPFVAAAGRYEAMFYRRAGNSGLQLPALSLGFWHNFGDDTSTGRQRPIVRRAFDLGITHFDLANNYGPPPGSAEENFGRILANGPSALPRRAHHLDQGRLRHVARAVRRVGLAQVPAGQPRPEPQAHGPRLRRHLLLAPPRPGHAARGDHGRARHGRPSGQGALRRHLELRPRRHDRGERHPAPTGHAPADPPAVVLHVRPLDRGRPARRARRGTASAASPSRRWRRACSPTAT